MIELLAVAAMAILSMAWYPCCCDTLASCAYCSGTVPLNIRFSISGVAVGSCADCADCDADYNCAWQGDEGDPPAGTCTWESATGTRVCDAGTWYDVFARVTITYQNPPLDNYAVVGTLVFVNEFGNQFIAERFRHDYGSSKPDCSAWSSYSLTYEDVGGTYVCDQSSATATITSL